MPDILIALAYIGILLLPIVVATRNTRDLGKDDYNPDPKTLHKWETWRLSSAPSRRRPEPQRKQV